MPPHEEQHSTKASVHIFSVVFLMSIIVAVDLSVVVFRAWCAPRNGVRSYRRCELARRLFAVVRSWNARKQPTPAPGCRESCNETKAYHSGGLRRSSSKCFPGSHRRSISHPLTVGDRKSTRL